MAPAFPWFALVLLVLGSTGVAAAWVAAAMVSETQCAWMAVVAALDAAWLLRLAGAPRGGTRMAAGVLATATAIVLAHWGIVSAHLAGMMGLSLFDTAAEASTASRLQIAASTHSAAAFTPHANSAI